jgi:ATP-binding cassette subfamily C protein
MDPDVAVLDEATAEAGSAGARELDRAADAATAGRTTLIVAHRLSQAARADRVVVLDRGAVVEVGRHEELIHAGGRYADLWRSWSGGR